MVGQGLPWAAGRCGVGAGEIGARREPQFDIRSDQHLAENVVFGWFRGLDRVSRAHLGGIHIHFYEESDGAHPARSQACFFTETARSAVQ